MDEEGIYHFEAVHDSHQSISIASDQSLTISESVPEINIQWSTCTLRCCYLEAMSLIIDCMLIIYCTICSKARTKAVSFYFHSHVAHTECFPEDLLPCV